MRSHKTLTSLCAAVLLAPATAAAQEVALNAEGAEEKYEHPRGYYCGVKPGGDQAPAIAAKPGSAPAITWPGFQMMPDGSSRVFVQITRQVDVSAAFVGGKVVVDLGDVGVVGATNRLPLITKFFNTPVTLVEVQRANKRTRLVLSMRQRVEPRVSHDQAKSGFHFVYVDFPAGNYAAQPTPATAQQTVDLPEAAKPEDATTRAAPTHIEGDAAASGQVNAGASGSVRASGGARVDTSMDGELPPGMGEAKGKADGKAKAGGKLKFGTGK